MGFIACTAIGLVAFLLGWQLKEHDENEKILEFFYRWSRPISLFLLTAIVIITYVIFKNPIVNLFKPEGADSAVTQWIISIIIGAVPAFFLWKWKNNDKKEELEKAERELRIKETNNDWDNLQKYQAVIQSESNALTKKTAIHALGLYYNRTDDFPQLVHEFFRNLLDDYWEKHKIEKIVPVDIEAIYNVINKHKLFLNLGDSLALTGFNLSHYRLPIGEDLSNSFFIFATLDFAMSIHTNFSNSTFLYASLYNAHLDATILYGANLKHTLLVGTNLENIKYDDKTKWESAIYLDKNNIENFKGLVSKSQNIPYTDEIIASIQETIFPVGFNPRDHKMIEICDFHKLHGLPHTLKVFNKA